MWWGEWTWFSWSGCIGSGGVVGGGDSVRWSESGGQGGGGEGGEWLAAIGGWWGVVEEECLCLDDDWTMVIGGCL